MKKITTLILLLFSTLIIISQHADPEIDYKKLEQLIAFCDTTTEATEVLIFHKNKEIAYWRDGDCHTYGINTSSMVKSWTGLVVGISIDKKILI